MALETLFMQHKGTVTQFTGERIAHCSTEHSEKTNWIELDLFITDSDQWVLQGIGRTTVPTESDRYWVRMSYEPIEIIEGLIRNGELSWPGKCLLSEALKYLAECVCD
jgi:hypothetical protein